MRSLFLLLWAGMLQAQSPAVIVMSLTTPLESPAAQAQIRVYTEAFQRLDLKLKVINLPSLRASYMAERGETDGELARGAQYARAYPGLIRVEEPVLITEFVALARNPAIRLRGWDALKGAGYRVEYVRGVQYPKEMLESRVPVWNLSEVATQLQGLKKLQAGRTDIFVDVEASVRPLLNADEFRDSGIFVAGVLERSPIHAYFNKKHAVLATRLSQVLLKMKKEGTVARLLRGPE